VSDQFGLFTFFSTEFFPHNVHVTWCINPESNGVWTDSYDGDRYLITDQDSFAWLP
jgi:hypothetical protein